MHYSLVEGSQQTDSIHYPSKFHFRCPSQLPMGSPRIILLQRHFPVVKPIIVTQVQQGSNLKQIKNTSYTNRQQVKTQCNEQLEIPKQEKILKEKNKKLQLRKNMTKKLLKITEYLGSYRKP
ncbi:unnamed protein product (macronuclear) [Paramecium tetraurelia]|uniref:Uncharacterized protein n=1 Tax=Paramecium tetraurelia TaxID=5888 RepID=A0DIS9_PARTE|nr:uncharacterized protein GSPATT00017303001 [Paramecium tetraurelia]CAK82946.1 unnamed protein product [Paramecium tetraurelia]|eukprot:XP_001450343.1 hypothetical protein (macronuclear) [Paramecium tetraurelia strain d4-2]